MSTTLTLNGRQTLRRVLPIVAMGAALLLVAGFVYLSAVRSVDAAKPSDFGLTEGNTISAAGSSDPDVYIVNDWGYKRLFLNPAIFGFYGHLGGFAKIKSVSPVTRDAFGTSGIFRNCETNDLKVYGVETTGEDTGMLHWVNTSGAQAVIDDPMFFNKVFCINSNEFNWYSKGTDYTSVKQVLTYVRSGVPMVSGTPMPVSGSVNVTLAADNPGAASITTKATGVTYLKLNFSGTGTISSMKVYRKGPGAAADFANVYIYDGARRLTSGRTPSSSDGGVTFSNLNIAVNGSKVLSVVADAVTAGGTVGDVNSFALMSMSDVMMTAGSTVGGSFPLMGSNFVITGQAGGTITLAKVGSLSDPSVGASNAQLSSFKLTTNTEGARVYRLQMINGGTVKSTDISGLHVDVNGIKIADGTMTADGYVVFDLSASPFFIAKGDNRVFNVYGSLNGKKAETVKLYFESNTDLLAMGDQFGFGVQPDIAPMDTTAEAFALTLQGGVLTLTFAGPTASTLGTSTAKTHFLDFDINSAANVELRKHTLVLCKDNAGNGTYDANSDTTNGWGDIDNISIIDRDSGVTLVGPQNGSAFTTSNTSCPGGVAGAAKQFTDTFNLTNGQTLHLAVVGDVKTANTGGVQITSGDIVKTIIDGYGDAVTTSGDLTIARYTNTNTALASTDIVPAGDISGNNMTVQTSSLALSLGSSPTGTLRYVKGTQDLTAGAFSFATALGNQVTVTNLTLTGYALDRGTSSTSAGTMQKGCDAAPDTAVCVGTMVSHIRLIDSSTGQIIASDPSTGGNSLSNTTGTAVFNGLNWIIPGGSTKTLLVKTDLSTNATSGSKDWFSFDIVATTDVTAVDANSNTINAGNAAVNGTNPTTYVVVNNVGTLASTLAPDSPIQTGTYWGQVDAPYSKFRFTSTNEAFPIERLNLYTADVTASLTQNIDSVKISYTNKAGTTLTSSQTFNNAGSTSFAFNPPSSGQTDTRPYVPKDGSLDITVTATLKAAAQQFRKITDANFVSIDLSAINADEFRAVGEGSGNVVDGTGITTRAANNMYMYRSFPKFTTLADTATTVAIGQDVFKFSIDAIGLASDGATLFFDGATGAASGSLKFAILASGAQATTTVLGFDLRRIVDTNGLAVNQLIATRSLTTGTDTDFNNSTGKASSLSMRFGDVAANPTIEIQGGKSSTFILRLTNTTGFTKALNTTTGRAADFVQVLLRDNEASLVRWTDKGGLDRINSNNSTTTVLKDLPLTGRRINVQ